MSSVDFLHRLLAGVEVEWKRLGDVARIRNGKDHKTLGEGEFPVFGSGGIMRYADTYAYNKPSVLIPRKGSLGNLFFVDVPFWNVDTIFYTEINEALISPKFLYYFLTTAGLGEMNQAGGVPSQTQSVLNELKIPIPCPDNLKKSLEIQAEIVRILDTFTELTAELTAELTSELTARKKQYNYYRDQLLSFEEGEVEWKMLGEVFDIHAGGDVPKNALSAVETEEFCTPVLSNGVEEKSLYGWTTIPKITKPSLTVSARGTIGWTSYRDYPFFPIVRLLVLTPKIPINLKYAYYFMKTIEDSYPVPAAGIPQLTRPMISDYSIPIPYPDNPKRSSEAQDRIVAILDKFDALTNSITEGLPSEIELRQKQYEHYRDLLFSFPKPKENVAAEH